MANLDQSKWFTEISDRDGSAFSLRINKKLDEKQSPFQKVEMFETTDFGNLMIIDSCTMVSSRENFFYHEMISHPALLEHPNPKNVVIIGENVEYQKKHIENIKDMVGKNRIFK